MRNIFVVPTRRILCVSPRSATTSNTIFNIKYCCFTPEWVLVFSTTTVMTIATSPGLGWDYYSTCRDSFR